MALWSEYLAKKLIFDNHPSLDGNRCLNHVQTRSLCTVCRDICPAGVFSLSGPEVPVPDWTACINCGLCAGACPSRAIAPAGLQIQRQYTAATNVQKTPYHKDITISCLNGQNADIYTEYPGGLSWEYLCFPALQGRVLLITGDCQSCEKQCCRRQLEKNLAAARSFFRGSGIFPDTSPEVAGSAAGPVSPCGEDIREKTPDYASNLIVTRDPDAVPPRRYTRREALSLAVRRSGQTASSVLPSLQESVPDGTVWRRLLLRRMDLAADRGRGCPFFLLLPAFRETCTACGICARLCPAGAILRVPGPEGSGRFYMALLPEKCTGCGICAGVCPEKALQAPAPVRMAAPVRPRLHAVAAAPCPRCGEPVPAGTGSGLCARCRGEQGCF